MQQKMRWMRVRCPFKSLPSIHHTSFEMILLKSKKKKKKESFFFILFLKYATDAMKNKDKKWEVRVLR